jgi:hypothetical protein
MPIGEKLEDTAMWHVETKKRFIAEFNAWLDEYTAINEDGVRVEEVGSTREKALRLRYESEDLNFEFLASRYDADGQQLLDHYVVILDLAFGQMEREGKAPLSAEQEARIEREIESALRAWANRSSGTGGPSAAGEILGQTLGRNHAMSRLFPLSAGSLSRNLHWSVRLQGGQKGEHIRRGKKGGDDAQTFRDHRNASITDTPLFRRP